MSLTKVVKKAKPQIAQISTERDFCVNLCYLWLNLLNRITERTQVRRNKSRIELQQPST